jgi:hypothetical protein
LVCTIGPKIVANVQCVAKSEDLLMPGRDVYALNVAKYTTKAMTGRSVVVTSVPSVADLEI